ncbi:uncharacterized protein LOC131210822 isoform X2 [Anopheles bellator]|nr:uncharacterized protein LOC131210822 isoform X2 [Anopheles bellator]
MNDAVLDLTQRAFETMGFEIYDQNGLHCNSLKHLVVAPNIIVKNLKPPPLLPVSDATLRRIFDIPDEEGDRSYVELQIKSLMDIVHHYEEELLSDNPSAAITKEQIKNQEGMVQKISKNSEREHSTIRRNLSKQRKTTQSVEVSNPTKDELAIKRQEAMREFQLLVQLVKYIITKLMNTELVNKQNLIASLRTFRRSYERSEERQQPIANQISTSNSMENKLENSNVASTSKKPRKNEETNTGDFQLA